MKFAWFAGVAAIGSLGVVLWACSSDKGTESDAGKSPGNPNAASIDEYFDSLPDYILTPPAPAATVDLAPSYAIHDDNGWTLDYRCGAERKQLVATVDEIMSPDQNFGVLWPGAVIQGASIGSGQLKAIPLDRAPMTLTISVDAPVTSIVVDNPTSVTAQQAVSDLKRSVDANLNGGSAPSNPGTVKFKVEAANSFSQSMLSMGITGAYSQPMAAEIGGSASMGLTRGYEEHTIVARLVQRLFTIRIADDLPALREPSGFFASNVTVGDFKAQETAGNIGPDNLPMYIESVTYGRIIVFTLKSYTATSVEDLKLAVNAAYQKYEGSGNIGSHEQEVLDSREVEVYQSGGDAAAAQAAVASLDFSQFFTDMEATEAVPLSFKAKTLKAGSTGDFVQIFDSTTYDERENCDRPTGYEITVTLDHVNHTSTFCASCPWNSQAVPTKQGSLLFNLGVGVFAGSPPHTATGNTKSFVFDEPGRSDLIKSKFNFKSELNGVADGSPDHEYPFNRVKRGETYSEPKRVVNGLGATAEFYYKVTKTPRY